MPGTLMIVSNPPSFCCKGCKELYKKAKRLKPDITKQEFKKAQKAFFAQYGRKMKLSDISLKDIPGKSNKDKIVIHVGKMKSLDYQTKKSRKKGKHTYRHKCSNQDVYSSVDGKRFYTKGKMKVRQDGWLIK